MRWLPDGAKAIKREDGHYGIFRCPQEGHVPDGGTITFCLVDKAKHTVIGGKRGVENTPEAISAAVRKLKAKVDNA